ncbi:uncharacterized protein PG986_013910 [Apiospora aurea]|uniref:SET domain-containing protein n=1 Tax=Apiospora aurea TaxID=335848 RepID=A0ABR1PWW2_9PEZI
MSPQPHPYQNLPVPNDAPFVRKPSGPGKGWGAFAARPIPRGAVILREKPLFTIPKHHATITAADVLSALRASSPAAQQRFRALRDRHATVPFQDPAKAFAENSFALGTADPIINSPAHGFFPLLSRFNHCCLPNAAVPLINAQDAAADVGPALIATRDIARGDEIAFSYDPRFESRTARERHASLGFACGCRACHPPGTRSQRASDLRRRLVRGLQFMVSGADSGRLRDREASARCRGHGGNVPETGKRQDCEVRHGTEDRGCETAGCIFALRTC